MRILQKIYVNAIYWLAAVAIFPLWERGKSSLNREVIKPGPASSVKEYWLRNILALNDRGLNPVYARIFMCVIYFQ